MGRMKMGSTKRLLFVTRKYPPIKGGMEQYSYDFYNNIKKKITTDLFANIRGNKYLPLFLIKVFFFIIFNGRKYSNIHFGDALLSPLIIPAKIFSKAKITISIMALDIMYKNPVYQWIIPKTVNMAKKIVCISNFTLEECVKRGVKREKCIFIPCGIDFSNLKDTKLNLKDISKKYKINFKKKKILLSVGRLVKRKGNAWFVSEVMPNLGEEYIYLIAGDGPEKDNIRRAIVRNNLKRKVFMLGEISEDEKICLYKNSYLFIMPNIKVPGDAEGFGITLIEAAAYGLPSVASNIEGIKDAIVNEKSGYLLERNSSSFRNKIMKYKRIAKKEIQKVNRNFDWREIAIKYVMVFK
jgi:glycosyltransferase involved in cell wall biosynthesis